MNGLWRDDAERPSLRALQIPARLLLTLFLLAAGAGFAVGEQNVLATVGAADGDPALSLEDLRRTYHGRPGWTLLGSKVDGGTMEKHVPIPSEKKALLDWARGGARREAFDAARAVLDARCLRCHSPGGEKEDAPFGAARESGAEYARVAPYAGPDRGMTPSKRATTTHAHLLGMGTLFLAMGAIFLLSNTRRGVRIAAIAAPFVGMGLNIGCWWLAILSPAFVWGIVAGGALMAAGAVVLVVRPLWEMWGPEARGLRV